MSTQDEIEHLEWCIEKYTRELKELKALEKPTRADTLYALSKYLKAAGFTCRVASGSSCAMYAETPLGEHTIWLLRDSWHHDFKSGTAHPEHNGYSPTIYQAITDIVLPLYAK